MRNRRPWNGFIKYSALLLIWSAVVIAGLELGLRLINRIRGGELGYSIVKGSYIIPSTAPGLYVELNPQMSDRLVRVNSHGFRGEEFPIAKPAGELRIGIVGDSVPFGLGIPQSDIVSEVLSWRLREAHPGRPIRVINAGVPSYNASQALAMADYRLAAFKPDATVAFLNLTDFYPPTCVRASEGLPRILFRNSALFRAAFLASVKLQSEFSSEENYRWLQANIAAVRTFFARAKQYPVRNYIVIYRRPQTPGNHDANDLFMTKLAAESGAEWLDVCDVLLKRFKSLDDIGISATDGHLNTEATAVLAAEIQRRMESAGLFGPPPTTGSAEARP